MAAWLPWATAVATLIGVLVTLFRWRREEADSVVDRYSKAMDDIGELVDRKNVEEDRLRARLDECRGQCVRLSDELKLKQGEVMLLEAQVRRAERRRLDS